MSGPRVLVIDDEAEIGELVVSAAQLCGYNGEAVTNAQDFRAKLADFKPGLLVLDLQLPDIDGVMLLRELAERGSKAKIIIMSGFDSKVVESARQLGIGRGLDAILPASNDVGEPSYRDVPTDLIRPNPTQPRRAFDEEALERLAETISEAGILQPLVVRPLDDGRYELIAGERRWRAAQIAGLETVPAILRTEEETKRLQMALIENMARESLNPVEEARGCAALVEELDLSKEETARRLGKSRSAVSNLIRILELPDPVLELLESGELTEGHGRALLAAL